MDIRSLTTRSCQVALGLAAAGFAAAQSPADSAALPPPLLRGRPDSPGLRSGGRTGQSQFAIAPLPGLPDQNLEHFPPSIPSIFQKTQMPAQPSRRSTSRSGQSLEPEAPKGSP